jgi:ribosomal protein S12 methylthiotransferase
LIGTVSRVIIESFDAGSGMHLGRTQAHAPEVDGAVYVTGKGDIRPGDFVNVKITQAQDYDLIGEITHG